MATAQGKGGASLGGFLAHGRNVEGDLSLIHQVLVNLLSNAMKYSRKAAAPAIVIGSRNDEKSGMLTIFVRDNGVGFNQANAEKIFEPFVRLNPKSEYQGNGLGLFICKKIVARHNGIIYAEGNEKQGARFVLVLPETP